MNPVFLPLFHPDAKILREKIADIAGAAPPPSYWLHGDRVSKSHRMPIATDSDLVYIVMFCKLCY